MERCTPSDYAYLVVMSSPGPPPLLKHTPSAHTFSAQHCAHPPPLRPPSVRSPVSNSCTCSRKDSWCSKMETRAALLLHCAAPWLPHARLDRGNRPCMTSQTPWLS